MLRNQKFHEQTECAIFIREDHEKDVAEKVKELEEEEKRAERVKEMQKARKQLREDKQKVVEKPKPAAKNITASSKPMIRPTNDKQRVLPGYFDKKGDKAAVAKPKTKDPEPSDVSGGSRYPTRSRDKKIESKVKAEK